MDMRMQARMKNPAVVLPGANGGIQTMMGSIFQSGVPKEVLDLAGLRVGQLNVCELCIGQAMGNIEPGSKQAERLQAVATWQTADCFSESEQVALALTEAITKLGGRYDSVPDALWSDVERLYNESARAGLVLFISAMNMFTRINVSTRQITPDWEA
jgi:alkylhydroperoxidase family enzyme